MELVRESRSAAADYVWMASTLGGNPVSTAAGLAALEVFRRPGTYQRLHALGRRFRDGLRAVLAERGEAAQVIGDGPLAQVVFGREPVRDYRGIRRGDAGRGRALMLGLFARGVFLNPMGTKLYLSLAHDEAACGAFLDRFAEALSQA
jgi:glutamate-1-semialdehyde 2,1-aminomutase